MRAIIFGLIFAVVCLPSAHAEPSVREIAITIDDLPFVGDAKHNPNNLRREHERFMNILNTLIEKKVPAIGFVIPGSIETGQWQLLEAFRDAGFEVGNHTYSHANLNQMSADKYIENIARADKILEPIMTKPKYFRYPYLAEGSGEKKQQVLDYLHANGYIVAPVTIDSKDYKFNNQLFAIPYRQRPSRLGEMRKRYLNFVWAATLRAEKKEGDGHVKQILLIHANLLNSHFIGDLIDMYRQHGYKFITIDEALEPVTEEERQELDNN